MGLKQISYGAFGSGKTAFAATMAEVCSIGVIDTEQRWQYYTEPHPTEKPLVPRDPSMLGADAYANPRALRQDVDWLPKTSNVIWLVQTMDPMHAWEVSKIWARDGGIGGQVRDSASVLWDMLQDSRDTDPSLGGLAWVPVKRTDRRMVYTLLEGRQHWILIAHLQELMNSEMKVIGTKPWVEKKSPHWADVVMQHVFSSEWPRPKMRVEKEKILGGRGGGLKVGTVLEAPTFRQVLELAGGDRTVVNKPARLDEIEARTKNLLAQVASSPAQPAADADPKEGK